MPYALPKRSKSNVVAANRLNGMCSGPDSKDLSTRVYVEVVSKCIAALASSTMVSLGILVGL